MEENNSQSSIKPRIIEQEMKESYLAYAMSVIIGRAIPDIRDGLKPVHRRILFAMQEMGMFHNKPYKKSARIVGEVLGKFHPHGDAAVYDSMVRMAQDFSLRYTLIEGQGNFGSVDGDSAAAMRYTEARLDKRAEELLKDIDKNTVDFIPNFDGSLEEPSFLPAKLPNLLINGSTGIAVGMATNIPPHNLKEVCDGVIGLIDNPEMEINEMLNIIPAPDFPTGGTILGTAGIQQAYLKGYGRVVIQAKADIEEHNGKKRIIVTEIPYMVNKSTLLEQIADLVKEKRVEGISDLRDESDRDGMRIVIELKSSANDQVVLNQLYKHSRLKDSSGITLLSIVDNQPKVLGIIDILKNFITHRQNVVRRRTQYELDQAKAREHIVKGLVIALDNIDEVIRKIKSSQTSNDASLTLQQDYGLSEKQTKAILEMRLQKLSSLEQQKLRDELSELEKTISALMRILESEEEILSIIKTETIEMRDTYGDDRKSLIQETDDELLDEDLIQEETMVVTLSHKGYVKRVSLDTYKTQNRGGKGVMGAGTKDEDFIENVFVASTHDYLLCFTNKGKVYWKKVYTLPEAGRTARGTPIINLIQVEQDEKVTAVVPISKFEEGWFLTFATKNATVKRTPLELFSKPRNGGIIALGLDEGDELIQVLLTDGTKQILLASRNGNAVKCKESDISVVGRTARGVRGMRLRSDSLAGMIIADEESTILTITEKGFGKRTNVSDYRLINRGGLGVRNIKCTEKNGKVVAIRQVSGNEDLLLISKKGIIIRTKASNISIIGRNTQGVRIMRLNDGDEVVAVAKTDESEEIESSEDALVKEPEMEAEDVNPEELDETEESDEEVEDSEENSERVQE